MVNESKERPVHIEMKIGQVNNFFSNDAQFGMRKYDLDQMKAEFKDIQRKVS